MTSDQGSVVAVGADGCRAGWIAAVLTGTGVHEHLRFRLFATISDLAAWRAAQAPGAAVGLDVPMGLTATGERRPCDVAARKELGSLAGSVFAPPGRYLLGALGYAEVRALVEELRSTSPDAPGVSAQSAGIISKIAEVDAFLLAQPAAQDWLIEVHPELSFGRWAGSALGGKRSPAGAIQRLRLVRDRFTGIEDALAELSSTGSRIGFDDALDACAALWSALRWPDDAVVLGGERDDRGLLMRMVV